MKTPRQILLLGTCLLWYPLSVVAQNISSLCPNTALAPVFKQDFGQASSPSNTSTAPAGSTNYNFGSVGSDGNYVLTPLIENANKNDWTKGGDHTGNTNGNMFLVNAGGGKSIFFEQIVSGLCPGSSFNFSAWIANVNTSKTLDICGAGLVYPKVIFNIKDLSGTVLGTITTGSLPLSPDNGPANWNQYGFQFSLPSGITSLILEMVDFHGGAAACGNDLALDDILFSVCTPQTLIGLTTPATICAGSNTQINSSILNSPYSSPAFQWQKSNDNGNTWINIGIPGSTANSYSLNNVSVSDGGLYRVIAGPDLASLSSSSCISSSNSINLIVKANPIVLLTNNGPLCSGSSLNLQSTVTGAVSPIQYSWRGPNAFSSIAATPTIVSSSVSSTGTYQLQVTDSNSCTTITSMNVMVNEKPILTILNLAQNICSNTVSQINLSSSINGSFFNGQSVIVSGMVTGNSQGSSSTTFNQINDQLINPGTSPAIVKYIINNTTALGCVATDSTQVTIFPLPTAANAGLDQTICNSNNTILSGNIPAIGSGKWSFVSGPSSVVFSDSTSTTSSLSGLINGVYLLKWTISNANCVSSSDTVAITLLPPPTIANAGIDQTICNLAMTNLSGNTPLVGIGTWSLIAGDSSIRFADIHLPNSVITGLVNGSYQLVWTISNSNCTDSKDTVTITVLPPPSIANAGLDQTICNTSTTSLNGNIPALGSGKWSFVSGPSALVFSDSTSTTSSVSGLITGVYLLKWTISNANCTSSSDTVAITLLPPPTIANAGTDQTICNFTNPTLSGNTPVVGIGTWSLIAGDSSIQFADIHLPNTVITGLVNGTYQLGWTISNGNCIYSKDTVTITVLPPPSIANAGLDQTICNSNNTILSGNIPAIGSGKWSFVSGPSALVFSDSTSASSSVNGLITGVYLLKWTISNANCTSSSDTVAITLLPPPTIANAGTDQTICNFTNPTLSGNTPVVGIGTWSLIAGDSSIRFADIHLPNTVVTGLVNGSYQLVWTISNSNCTDSKDTVTITVLPPTSISNAGVDQTICNTSTTSLNGNIPSTGSGKWSFVSGPSALVFSDSTSASSSVNGLITGVYLLKWTISNANCVSSSDTVAITLLPPPTIANAGTDQTICNFTNPTLSGNTPVVGIGTWSLIAGDSSIQIADIHLPNTVVTGLVNGTYQLGWTISNSNCTYSKDTVTITVLPPPSIANAGLDQTICNTSTTSLNGNIPSTGSGKWSFVSGPSALVFSDSTSATSSLSGLINGVYLLKWTISNTNCASSSDTVAITLLPPPTIAYAGTDQNICNSAMTNLSGNTPVVGIGTWSLIAGDSSIQFANIHLPNTVITGLVNGTYQLGWTISNGNCTDSKDTVTITVLPPPSIANVGVDQTICNTDRILLHATTPIIGSGKWTLLAAPNKPIFNQSDSAKTEVSGILAGTYQFVWQINSSVCEASKDTVHITILPAITNIIDTIKKIVCYGSNVTLKGQIGSGGNNSFIYQWEKSIDSINWTSIKTGIGIDYTFDATESYYFRRTLQSANCRLISNTVFVSVQNALSGNSISANQEICMGSSFQPLTGTIPSGGGGSYVYQWERKSDSDQTWLPIEKATYINLDTFSILSTVHFRRLINTAYCNGLFADTSNEVSITVRPHAKAELVLGNLQGCAPYLIDSFQIKPKQNLGNNKNYQWYTNNKLTATSDIFPSYLLTTDSVHIMMVANSIYGCKPDTTKTVFSIYEKPKPTIQLSDTVGCGPLSVNFKNETALSSKFTFYWDLGNGSQTNLTDPGSIVYNGAYSLLDTVYQINLKAIGKCDTVIENRNIIVKSKPKADLTVNILNGCSPMQVHFQNKSTAVNSTFQLFFGDGNTGILLLNDTLTHTYHSGQIIYFPAKLIASNQCGIDSIVKPIKTLPNPVTVSLQLNDTAVCGAPFTLSIQNNTIASKKISWEWGDGSASTISNTTDRIAHTYQKTGNYTIKNTISSSCSDSVVYRPVYIFPSIKARSDSSIKIACIGEKINFTNQSDSILSFIWDLGDNSQSTRRDLLHNYLQAGNYIAKLRTWIHHPQVSCFDSTFIPVKINSQTKGKFTISDTIGNCLPFKVTVYNQNLPALQTSWNWGDGSFGTGDTATHQYTANGTYKVIMTSIAAGGCLYIDSSYILINAPDALLSYKGGIYCSLKNDINFTAQATNADSIKWDFGDGIFITSKEKNISHQYTQKGIFLPRITLINNLSGCLVPMTGIDTIRIDEVNADIQLSALYDCGKTTYQLKDKSESFFPITQRFWRLDQKIIDDKKEFSYSFQKPGENKATIRVSTVYGCMDSIQARFKVNIYQFPQANINAINEACMNNILELTSEVNSVDSIKARFWNLGNGTNATDSIVKVYYYSEGMYTIKLTVATINSCYDSAFKHLRIHPKPTISLAPEQILCKGDSVVLRANGAKSYIWKDQNNKVICNNCTETIVQPNKNTRYNVIGYSEYGCSNIASTNIRVIPPLKLSVKTPDTICLGESKRLLVSGGASYEWKAEPSLNNSKSPSPIVTPLATTTYQVKAKDNYQCFTDSAEIKIVVGKPTSISIGRDTAILSSVPVQLKVFSNVNDIKKWQWKGNASFSCIFCQEPTAKVVFDECLSCTATNIYGCISTDTVCIKTFCPNSEIYIPNAFSPDGDGINDLLIVQGRGLKQVKSFRIYNRWGEMVFEKVNFFPGDIASGWNGKIRGAAASHDVYVYICEVLCERGIPATFKGNVAILK